MPQECRDGVKWEYIENTKNMYIVNTLGHVFSVKSDRLLAQHVNHKGYLMTTVIVDGLHSTFIVHRKVAIAFIANPLNKKEVNHKNGIKTDNRVENLEWATPSENRIHAYKNGLHSVKGERNSQSLLTDDLVRQIREFYDNNIGAPNKIWAEKLGLSICVISSVKLRRSWKHVI